MASWQHLPPASTLPSAAGPSDRPFTANSFVATTSASQPGNAAPMSYPSPQQSPPQQQQQAPPPGTQSGAYMYAPYTYTPQAQGPAYGVAPQPPVASTSVSPGTNLAAISAEAFAAKKARGRPRKTPGQQPDDDPNNPGSKRKKGKTTAENPYAQAKSALMTAISRCPEYQQSREKFVGKQEEPNKPLRYLPQLSKQELVTVARQLGIGLEQYAPYITPEEIKGHFKQARGRKRCRPDADIPVDAEGNPIGSPQVGVYTQSAPSASVAHAMTSPDAAAAAASAASLASYGYGSSQQKVSYYEPGRGPAAGGTGDVAYHMQQAQIQQQLEQLQGSFRSMTAEGIARWIMQQPQNYQSIYMTLVPESIRDAVVSFSHQMYERPGGHQPQMALEAAAPKADDKEPGGGRPQQGELPVDGE